MNSRSYLEFGALDTNGLQKVIWDLKEGDKAYEWYMAARYLNDLLGYRRLAQQIGKVTLNDVVSYYRKEIHHQNDISIHLGKLIALDVLKQSDDLVSYFELGSTLMGCIEGIAFSQQLLKAYKVDLEVLDLEKVRWFGVDISQMYNETAVLLHKNYAVQTTVDESVLERPGGLFFAKGVSLLYAIQSVEKLVSLLDKHSLSLFDLSFSLKQDEEEFLGTGKKVHFLCLRNFLKQIKKTDKKLYVRKNKSYYDEKLDRIFIDGIFGYEEDLNHFVKKDILIRNELRKNLRSEVAVKSFLDLKVEESVEWVLLEVFVEKFNKASLLSV